MRKRMMAWLLTAAMLVTSVNPGVIAYAAEETPVAVETEEATVGEAAEEETVPDTVEAVQAEEVQEETAVEEIQTVPEEQPVEVTEQEEITVEPDQEEKESKAVEEVIVDEEASAGTVEVTGELLLNAPQDLTPVNGEKKWFSFTPSETARYSFYTSYERNEMDSDDQYLSMWLRLYDAQETIIAECKYDGDRMRVSAPLQGGETYYLSVYVEDFYNVDTYTLTAERAPQITGVTVSPNFKIYPQSIGIYHLYFKYSIQYDNGTSYDNEQMPYSYNEYSTTPLTEERYGYPLNWTFDNAAWMSGSLSGYSDVGNHTISLSVEGYSSADTYTVQTMEDFFGTNVWDATGTYTGTIMADRYPAVKVMPSETKVYKFSSGENDASQTLYSSEGEWLNSGRVFTESLTAQNEYYMAFPYGEAGDSINVTVGNAAVVSNISVTTQNYTVKSDTYPEDWPITITYSSGEPTYTGTLNDWKDAQGNLISYRVKDENDEYTDEYYSTPGNYTLVVTAGASDSYEFAFQVTGRAQSEDYTALTLGENDIKVGSDDGDSAYGYYRFTAEQTGDYILSGITGSLGVENIYDSQEQELYSSPNYSTRKAIIAMKQGESYLLEMREIYIETEEGETSLNEYQININISESALSNFQLLSYPSTVIEGDVDLASGEKYRLSFDNGESIDTDGYNSTGYYIRRTITDMETEETLWSEDYMEVGKTYRILLTCSGIEQSYTVTCVSRDSIYQEIEVGETLISSSDLTQYYRFQAPDDGVYQLSWNQEVSYCSLRDFSTDDEIYYEDEDCLKMRNIQLTAGTKVYLKLMFQEAPIEGTITVKKIPTAKSISFELAGGSSIIQGTSCWDVSNSYTFTYSSEDTWSGDENEEDYNNSWPGYDKYDNSISYQIYQEDEQVGYYYNLDALGPGSYTLHVKSGDAEYTCGFTIISRADAATLLTIGSNNGQVNSESITYYRAPLGGTAYQIAVPRSCQLYYSKLDKYNVYDLDFAKETEDSYAINVAPGDVIGIRAWNEDTTSIDITVEPYDIYVTDIQPSFETDEIQIPVIAGAYEDIGSFQVTYNDGTKESLYIGETGKSGYKLAAYIQGEWDTYMNGLPSWYDKEAQYVLHVYTTGYEEEDSWSITQINPEDLKNGDYSPDTPMTISSTGRSFQYYSFVPQETKEYVFQRSTGEQAGLAVYYSDGICHGSCSGWDACLCVELTAGETYYVGGYRGNSDYEIQISEGVYDLTQYTEIKVSDVIYTGDTVAPEASDITITYGDQKLTAGTDYEVVSSYSYDYTAGSYSYVMIRGIGEYYGGFDLPYTIVPKDISEEDVQVAFLSDEVLYADGKIKEPTFTVTYNGKTVSQDEGYTYNYVNNVSAGTASVIINGWNNFTGTKTVSFTIHPRKPIAPDMISGIPDDVTYSGRSICPDIIVKDGEAVLIEDTDYTVEYNENVNVGWGGVTVVGAGAYCGSCQIPFAISPLSLSKTTDGLSWTSIPEQPYTGTKIEPEVELFYNDVPLPTDDYTVVYSNNIESGTATATITAESNNCEGSIAIEFQIVNKTDIGAATVTWEDDKTYTYTGNAITPIVSAVENGDIGLIKDTDYTVNYKSNVNAGTGVIIITGQGDNYAGTKQIEFTITPREITDTDITITGISDQTYTGEEIRLTPAISFGDQDLSVGSDYQVSYSEDVTNAGTVTMTISGQGNYNGNRDLTYGINPLTWEADKLTVQGIQSSYEYTGSQIAPAPTGISYDGTQLTGADYKVVGYNNNRNATSSDAPAAITIQGQGNYSGEVTVTFDIMPRGLSDATIDAITDAVYTGVAITPEPVVTLQGTTLVKDSDYTVTYSDNTDAGNQAKVLITGMNNYQGTCSATFVIQKADIAVADIAQQIYTGTAITPLLNVTSKKTGKALTTDEYTAVYSENLQCGTATVIISGQGNYTGTVTKTFEIIPDSKKDLGNATIDDIPAQTYTGSEIKPAVTVTLDGQPVDSKNYTVTYANNTHTGTAVVTVQGVGSYFGSKTVNYTINAMNLSTASLTRPASQYYTGTAFTPAVTVTCEGRTLTSQTDYTISYSNNTNIGMATITVTGKGNYTGSKSITFEINARQGASYTIGACKYKITNAASGGRGTVSVTGIAKKTTKSVTIPTTVTIGGTKFTVTEIAPRAFQKCSKLTKAVIPSGVTKIGTKAFYNCKKLKTIQIKSTKLKSVGKNAFKGIYKKARIKVPSKSLKKYKKLLKKKGQASGVKITK